METLKFKTNINCDGCVGAVTPFMEKEEGVKKWKVDTEDPQKLLTVQVQDIDAGKVIQVLEDAGFKAEVI